MSIIDLRKWLAAAAVLFISWPVAAADAMVFESCIDSRGRTLVAVKDEQQSMLVRAVGAAGLPTIHYNPDLLPRLTFAARLFLYSHECARVGLGDPAGGMSPARASMADCKGLTALLAGKVVKREDLPALQAEFSFSEKEWTLLPGPPRTFDLARCLSRRGDALRLPPDTPPSATQINWNDCVRACADRLWACQQNSCGGGDCQSCRTAYERCNAACAPAAGPTGR